MDIISIFSSIKNHKLLYGLAFLFLCGLLLYSMVLTLQEQKRQNIVQIVSPADHSTGVTLYQPVVITFKRPLTPAEQSTVHLSLEPQAAVTADWSSDHTTITYTPRTTLRNSQLYTATLFYLSYTRSWSFATVTAAQIPVEDQVRSQAEADRNFALWQQQVNADYPWFNSFPLQNTRYFVYFDLNQKKFIAKLYPHTSSGAIDTQVVQMKQEIDAKMKSVGVDTTRFEIDYTITPEP